MYLAGACGDISCSRVFDEYYWIVRAIGVLEPVFLCCEFFSPSNSVGTSLPISLVTGDPKYSREDRWQTLGAGFEYALTICFLLVYADQVFIFVWGNFVVGKDFLEEYIDVTVRQRSLSKPLRHRWYFLSNAWQFQFDYIRVIILLCCERDDAHNSITTLL